MHRHNADMIGKLYADCLHEIERIYEREVNRMHAPFIMVLSPEKS